MSDNEADSAIPVASRAAGLMLLSDLAETIARYGTSRNYADGHTTSRLSPYIRRRLLIEEEVLEFARSVGKFDAVEKFVQEVVWRTYWKGWLEARPIVWKTYLTRLQEIDETLRSADRDRFDCAINGRTDLAYFNAWCEELTTTGYLHNHVRMWFASIWIFTLNLPWELGARFFLNHLLDGDPASNTLSWRWVAGLQTPGKHYLARADNIARFTNGRWVPGRGELNESAQSLRDDGLGRIAAAKPDFVAEASEVRPEAVLLHDEDCGPWPDDWTSVPTIRYVVTERMQHRPSTLVERWITDSCRDLDARVGSIRQAHHAEEIRDWCRDHGVVEVWAFRPFQGFVEGALSIVADQLAADGIRLRYADRRHDINLFPLATRGFFPFWEAASGALRRRWR
ncbi:MAG: FAD-binding domain-containing protein [Planctomycetota bacterium]